MSDYTTTAKVELNVNAKQPAITFSHDKLFSISSFFR